MAGEGINLILVEDEESFARLVLDMLENERDEDFRPVWADTFTNAREILSRQPFDVCLLDLNLPDSRGLQTLQRFRSAEPEIPIVVLTGQNEEGLAQAVMAAGAQSFFNKPDISGKFLARVIHNAIERRYFELKLEKQARELEERVKERTRQLESAKQQWEQTFDAVPDQIMLLDRDFRVLRANKAVAESWGIPFSQIIGSHCYEIFHGGDSPIEGCPHLDMLADGREHHSEVIDEKRKRHYLVSTSPLHGADYRSWGCVHVARDVTDLKVVQAKLRESAERTQMILEQLPDPTAVYDMEGNVSYVNDAFLNTFGWTRQELMDSRNVFVPPEAREQTTAIYTEMEAGRPVRSFETVRRTKSGERLDVLLNTAPLPNADGSLSGNVVILHDITTMKRAEADRQRSEERFRTLVETMNEGLIIVDESRTLVYANARFYEMLGYSESELQGLSYLDLLDKDNREVFEQAWRSRLTGTINSYELAYNRKDGSRAHALISPKGMYDENDRFIGSFATVTDITDIKQLQSQLFQAQKMEGIGQLAAGIAHEINTPTQYVSSNTRFLIQGFSDVLELLKAHRSLIEGVRNRGIQEEEIVRLEDLINELDYDFLIDEIPKALNANREGLERITRIVLSMKEFAHPGREEIAPSDLNKAILNTITVARNEWKYFAEVQTELQDDLPLVPCVLSEINQVILNLVVNAAQAISEALPEGEKGKGRITIATRALEDCVNVTVNDNGPGIPMEIQERIFDPFFTTKEPGKGTGQGLAIAYRSIVDKHKGTITVDSKPGQGTTFLITLPLLQKNAEGRS